MSKKMIVINHYLLTHTVALIVVTGVDTHSNRVTGSPKIFNCLMALVTIFSRSNNFSSQPVRFFSFFSGSARRRMKIF